MARGAEDGVSLSAGELAMLRAVLARHPAVTGAVLFGSRAKGTAGPASDVDLERRP
ncbi:MAG: nucleotidyltransferase domain-containing protein [Deltaproteobacteria bacterium]|nr:nucleotidyltransferase domain-containing protein [Deltaproteobacteria bacterium]